MPPEPLYLQRCRDYLTRASGRTLQAHPGFHALLHSAAQSAEHWSGAPFSLECSLRIGARQTSADRYVVAFAAAQLGRQPQRVLANLTQGAHASTSPLPPLVQRWIERIVRGQLYPSAFLAGVDGLPGTTDAVAKLYMEQAPLEQLVHACVDSPGVPPPLAAASLEWRPCAADAVVRIYREAPALAPPFWALTGQLATHLHEQLREALQADRLFLRSDLTKGPQHGATAVQWLGRGVPLAHILPTLQAVAAALGLDPHGLAPLSGRLPEALVRVVGVGTTRAGESHLTVYHAPTPESLLLAGPEVPRTSPADQPGQVVLNLATPDGAAAGTLVIARAPAIRRPDAAAGDLVLYASRGSAPTVLAVAPEVAALLDDRSAHALAIRVAQNEPALHAHLAQHQLRLLRWTVVAAPPAQPSQVT